MALTEEILIHDVVSNIDKILSSIRSGHDF